MKRITSSIYIILRCDARFPNVLIAIYVLLTWYFKFRKSGQQWLQFIKLPLGIRNEPTVFKKQALIVKAILDLKGFVD